MTEIDAIEEDRDKYEYNSGADDDYERNTDDTMNQTFLQVEDILVKTLLSYQVCRMRSNPLRMNGNKS